MAVEIKGLRSRKGRKGVRWWGKRVRTRTLRRMVREDIEAVSRGIRGWAS